MNTYVMSDIHGCYDQLIKMLEKIDFSPADRLILAGDYIDRGPQNYEMLNWILASSQNVMLLCGNHEREFIANVELMQQVMETEIKGFDINSPEQTKLLYHLTEELLSGGDHRETLRLFDYYGTIQKLIHEKGVTFKQLARWAAAFDEMPYFYQISIRDRRCIIVHAGYIETVAGVPTEKTYASIEEFYLYARDDAYIHGGTSHGMIIAGHTPTIAEKELSYNRGNVYRFYDAQKDCVFYDIDCGCSYAGIRENAKLACIRIEDEKIFYV